MQQGAKKNDFDYIMQQGMKHNKHYKNNTLFTLGLKISAEKKRSNGTSEITANIRSKARYFFLDPVLKKPSTKNNANSGKAILPSTLNRRLNLSKNPSPLKYGVISA